MDEADRILNMDFEQEMDKILRAIPRERQARLQIFAFPAGPFFLKPNAIFLTILLLGRL